MTLSLEQITGAILKMNNLHNSYTNSFEIAINPEEELELDIFIKLPTTSSISNLSNSKEFNFVLLDNISNIRYVQPATFFTAK